MCQYHVTWQMKNEFAITLPDRQVSVLMDWQYQQCHWFALLVASVCVWVIISESAAIYDREVLLRCLSVPNASFSNAFCSIWCIFVALVSGIQYK
jgi:hypothetical protein